MGGGHSIHPHGLSSYRRGVVRKGIGERDEVRSWSRGWGDGDQTVSDSLKLYLQHEHEHEYKHEAGW
jgi:hypothetical protein